MINGLPSFIGGAWGGFAGLDVMGHRHNASQVGLFMEGSVRVVPFQKHQVQWNQGIFHPKAGIVLVKPKPHALLWW